MSAPYVCIKCGREMVSMNDVREYWNDIVCRWCDAVPLGPRALGEGARKERTDPTTPVTTPQELANFARSQLASVLERSGEVLYSGASTLQPGEVYLLGLNPGGSPDDPRLAKLTIGASIAELPTKTHNSYLDTTWVGRAFLKRRVKWLLPALGLNARDVAASNVSFVRSPDKKTAQIAHLGDLCWPVHERILDIVRPRLVLTYGDDAY